ncbi:MAG: lysylphosphatidylglycerol synthase transmembrane domain-containing protein [Candidatus Onthovivens sp.]|nr:lysylphosphatidylglycerol synthase transmembrane domain-containing protein [Candidatus Onthovivens sp.]
MKTTVVKYIMRMKQDLKKEKKKRYKYLIYLFLIIGLTAFVLYFSLRGNTKYNGEDILTIIAIGKIFADIDIGYLFLFLGLVLLYHFLSSFCIYFFARLYTRKYKFYEAIANELVGTFYNCITPGTNTGGQFAQAFTYKKQGMNISNAASIMVMQFIIYEFALLFVGFVSLFNLENVLSIKYISLFNVNIPIVIFVILGFIISLFKILGIIFMAVSRRLHNFITNNVIDFLSKIRIIKDAEPIKLNLRIQVENFRLEVRRLSSNIPFTILMLLIYIFMISLYYLFPFFIGLSLNSFELVGHPYINMYESISFSYFHQLISGIIPIPGGAGISEFIFNSLFSGYYSEEFVSNGGCKAAMLLWRMFTYYIPFLISAFVAFTYKGKGVKKEDRLYSLDNKTFVTLQLDAIEEKNNNNSPRHWTKSIDRNEIIERLKEEKNSKMNTEDK